MTWAQLFLVLAAVYVSPSLSTAARTIVVVVCLVLSVLVGLKPLV